jgi:hypothetical protein
MAPEPPRKKGLKNVKAWLGLLLFALAFVVGAFGVAVLAVELRDDDINRLSGDVSELRDEVRDLRAALEPTPGVTPTPSPTPTPIPEPVVARMAKGATVEWQGIRLTVQGYVLGSSEAPPRADFTLENVNARPETTTELFENVKVIDKDGFVCSSVAMSASRRFDPVQRGEKLSVGVNWQCKNRIVSTLTLGGGAIVFQFPQA